jgi:hypothetical protein
MANEISVSVSIRANKGFFSYVKSAAETIDMAGAGGGGPGQIAVPTAGIDVEFTGFDPGVAYFRNLDPTNYVVWGPKDTTLVPMGRLKPGEFAVLRINPGVTLRLAANTATCQCQVEVLRD